MPLTTFMNSSINQDNQLIKIHDLALGLTPLLEYRTISLKVLN
jgi:hypothetical protein